MVDIQTGPQAPPGSTVHLMHTKRTMNCYALFDSDLENLATLGFGQSVCLAISSASAALWFDLFKNTKLASEIPPASQELVAVFGPLSAAGAIIFAALTVMFWWRRKSKLDEIKRNSIAQNPSPAAD